MVEAGTELVEAGTEVSEAAAAKEIKPQTKSNIWLPLVIAVVVATTIASVVTYYVLRNRKSPEMALPTA